MSRVVLSVVFVILSLVALYAHQSPVNYIDSVDPVQANIANQKYAEWITANDADVDTLETINESVFQAVDTTGGQVVAEDDSAYINLDREVIKASIYVHAPDDYAVAINEAGTYEITYNVCATASTSSTTGLITSLCHYSSSWLNVRGTFMTNGCTDILNGSNSATVIMTLSAGDSLAVKMKHNSLGSANIVTAVDGIGLTIKKLY